MLYSMTGFGRAAATIGGRQVSAEIKSLNGKQFDLSPKLPYLLRAYDVDVRATLATMLVRGTTDLTISIKQDGISRPAAVNVELAVAYYKGMQEVARRLDLPEEAMLSTLMRMPEIISTEQDILPPDDWQEVKKIILEAAGKLMDHRKTEGLSLEKDLLHRIDNIEALLEKILPFEAERTERLKTRLRTLLNESVLQQPDENRFEQELIYYLEKIDFTEEKTRLTQHCSYFRETLGNTEISKGKVLGFILQEVGREINTMGSKANHASIQQMVVLMKDELEKAKEQVLNAL